MRKVIFTNVTEAKTLAKELSEELKGGEIFGLVGPLGAGKTTFTQAVAKILGVKKPMRSPTFVLMQSVKAKLPKNHKRAESKNIHIHHLDLYRLGGKSEITNLGFNDFLGKSDTITFIEWADKAKNILPKKTIYINFLPLKNPGNYETL